VSRSKDFQKRCLRFFRRIGAQLVPEEFAAPAKHAERLGAIPHVGVQAHQMAIARLAERFELDDFSRVLHGKRRLAMNRAGL
jgi:hypothetical protein